jgi:hypothetical protein
MDDYDKMTAKILSNEASPAEYQMERVPFIFCVPRSIPFRDLSFRVPFRGLAFRVPKRSVLVKLSISYFRYIF